MFNFFLSSLFILWTGLILGVSFIATPVKFMAPHLTMPVALEIGKATFYIFNKIEWVICLAVILFSANTGGHSNKWFIVGSLVGLLLLETFWLLPALDVRAGQTIAGEAANPGILHWLYIFADILKMVLASIGAYRILYEGQT